MDLSDQDVVALARLGQDPAYRELLRRYQGTVRKLLFHMVHDRELAEDLTQETFLRVHTSLHTHRPESKFSAWLYAIANNVGLDHLRRRELDTVSLDSSPFDDTPRGPEVTALQVAQSDPTPTPTPPPEREAQIAALREAVKRLHGDYRRCVELRHLDGRSYDSIGDILDLGTNTVKNYLHRAMKELRATLGARRADAPQRSTGGPPAIA